MADPTNDQMGPQQQNGPTQPPNPPAPAPAPQPDPTAQAPQGGINPNNPPSPPPPGSFFHNLSHSLIGAVLGHSLDAVAGNGGNTTTGYTTDDTGKQTPVIRKMSVPEKLQSIAARALQGLAAGAAAPEQKTGLASALAGMGAGAKAAKQSNIQDDARKRQLSSDEFEREQKATLQKADIMKSNMLTLSMGYANLKAGNDLTPEYARNQSTFDAAQENADFSGHTRIMTEDEAMAAQKNDKNFGATHKILPLGKVPTLDKDGKQLFNPDGSLQTHMQVGVFDASKDGKWAITPGEEADIHEYGPMANIRGSDSIYTGDLYDMHDVTHIMNEVNTVKKNVLQGWQHSTVGFVTDKDGKQVPIEINGVDQTRTRPFPGGVTPMAVETEQAEIGEKKAAGIKDTAEAQKARDEGTLALASAAQINAMLAAGGSNDPTLVDQAHKSIAALTLPDGSPNIAGQAALRTVKNPVTIASLLSVANGDADLNKVFPTRTTAKSGQLDAAHAIGLVRLINPDYNEELFKTKQNVQTDFTSGKTAANIQSFNQFLEHSAQAQQVINSFRTTNSPLLNKPLNWLRNNAEGDPDIARLYQALAPVQTEYTNFLKNNLQVNEQEEKKFDAAFNNNSSPAQMLAAMGEMTPQAISRLDAINEKYKETWARNFPNLLTPAGRAAAVQLGFGDAVEKYGSGGKVNGVMNQGGGPQAGQAPQIHEVVVNGQVAGYSADGGKTMYQTADAATKSAQTKQQPQQQPQQ